MPKKTKKNKDNQEKKEKTPLTLDTLQSYQEAASIGPIPKRTKKKKKHKCRKEDENLTVEDKVHELEHVEGFIPHDTAEDNEEICKLPKKKKKKKKISKDNEGQDITENHKDESDKHSHHVNMSDNDNTSETLVTKKKKKLKRHHKENTKAGMFSGKRNVSGKDDEYSADSSKHDENDPETNLPDDLGSPPKKKKKHKKNKKNSDGNTMHVEGQYSSQNEHDEGAQHKKDTAVGQWATAELGSSERNSKFMRLMGGFKKGSSDNDQMRQTVLGGSKPKFNTALNLTQESKLNKALENQFEQAVTFSLSRRDHKTGGLGFEIPPESNKKFHIDVNKTKSKVFDE